MNLQLETLVALISALSATISSIVAVLAIILSLQSNRQAQRSAVRESTEIIFKEWWSEELRELRRYFLSEFVPKHRAELIGKGMKDIDKVVPDDEGKVRRLCYFFDKVGWLGAAGLIEVDYVLGPMQQTMRHTWIVMEPLIMKERELVAGKRFDAVFQYGFEWLFRRSCQPNKHQAYLLGNKFAHPRVITRKQMGELKGQIEIDENKFRQELQIILEKARTTKKM